MSDQFDHISTNGGFRSLTNYEDVGILILGKALLMSIQEVESDV